MEVSENQELDMLSQARVLTPAASDDSDTPVSSDHAESPTRRVSHMSTLRLLASSFPRLFHNKQADDDTDRSSSAPGCISVEISTCRTDNRLYQVSRSKCQTYFSTQAMTSFLCQKRRKCQDI